MSEKPRVVGIAGITFKAKNPTDLTYWYDEFLGTESNDYGILFEHRNARDPKQANYIQWSPYPKSDSRLKSDYMISYRVVNLVGLVKQLREKGIEIYREDENPVGKYAWAFDPDGQEFELFEPNDEMFGDEPTTK